MINAEAEQGTLASRAAEVFQRYRDGDSQAMGELVAMLTPILWHTVRAQRLDKESTEDVLQTTWLALVRSADGVSDPRAVLQWLIVSARREAWRVMRGQSRQLPYEIDEDAIQTPAEELPESVVLRGTSEELLWSHIARLPDRCRALLRVIAFADRPDYPELARSLGGLATLRAALSTDARWELR
jgi:RNA polymerase sigma factor (sigma-70 family)